MQMKIGEKTAEFYAYSYLTNSWLSERVQEVTAGGVKLASDGYKKISKNLGATFDKNNSEGNRKIMNGFKRSEAYLKEKGEEAAD
jgi:hypothetical protein